jgi:acyl-CoA synthetase (AMP-forming)/AMP-acid ligase II
MSELLTRERAAASDPRLPRPTADTLPAFWRAVAEAYGEDGLLRKDGRSYSYREIDARSAALARGLLAEGAGKGARIGILAPNGPDWVIAWLAANRIGAIAVGLSTFFSARELAYAAPHADIQILLTADRYLRHDYLGRLEAAFPGLASADGAQPLALTAAPFLRSVWIIGESRRAWSRGGLDDLEALGAASERFSADLLAATEAAVSPADLALLIYTSGSTAHPKGVLHTQGAMIRKTLFLTRGTGITPVDTHREDRLIVTAPFFWVGGFLSLVGAMIRGATVICVDDHAPANLLAAVRSEKATHLSGADPLLNFIRDAPGAYDDWKRLRPIGNSQLAYFNKSKTGEPLVRSLGMTETLGPHSGLISDPRVPLDTAGTVGMVLEGMEYRFVDPETGAEVPAGQPGELCVRGDWLMAGMYKRERGEVFDADGFYHTGDLCTLRPDGFLFFHARIGGMIKTSGANVSPEEVEEVIRALDDVGEVAVVGVPDAKLGEMVVAAVVAAPGSPLDEAAVRARVQSQLSSFKAPKRVFFFDYLDLPRTPSNKIRKPALVEVIGGMLAAERQAAAPTGA